jgi:uncharacterized protein (TIRG00374 family)
MIKLEGTLGLKKWAQILGLIIGVISLYIFLVYFFDWETTKKLIIDAQVVPVCLSTFFLMIALFLRAVKWTYILRIKDRVTWKNGFHTIMISNMVNYIFPVRFGELLKLYIINKVSEITYSSSVSATISDRFSQLILMMMFILFTPLAGFSFSSWSTQFIFFLFFFIILSFLLFVYGTRCLEILEKGIRSFLNFIGTRKRAVDRVSESKIISFSKETLNKMNISAFTRMNLLIIFLLSFMIISIDGFCYYFIIKAFEVSITWLQGALLACFMVMMFVLPTPPGQVGTAEMYPVLILSWGLGLPSGVISSAAVLWHLLTTMVFLLLGVCSAVSLGVSFRSLFREIQEKRVDLRN